MIAYDITPIDLHGHLFEVILTIDAPEPELELWLPNWIPGSYLIRDFSKHIIGLYAESNGKPVPVKQITKNRWQLKSPAANEVTVKYQVYAWDLSVRSAYLDQLQGFFNNTSLCLAVVGQEDERCQLTLHPPVERFNWKVATGMPRISGQPHSWGTFEAESYDALIDYPFLIGDLTIEEFIAHGIKHSLVLSGRHFADTSKICSDLARICETQISMFDEAPFTSYTFLTMVVGDGFGGLEHRNSTALLCSRKSLIGEHDHEVNDDYQTFLSLCCHEYFHSWNVKTLKPKAFIPYQLDKESYTEQLWFYEGMTSYFDDYLLHASGIVSAEQYLNVLSETLARVERGAGQYQQSVTESSYLAWTKFYQQNENAPNSIVSYYAKGALLALSLDLMLRLQSSHSLTLAHVMKKLWHEFGKTGVGTADDTVLNVLDSYSGIDIADFLREQLYAKESLPLESLLNQFGLQITRSVPSDDNSLKVSGESASVSLGAKYKASSAGLELMSVYHDETAYNAGLSANDRIIAIDHLQVTDATVKSVLSRYRPGEKVTVHAFRRDELLTLDLIWEEPTPACWKLSIKDASKLNGWLTPES
ncbi:M61 family metallopeptidase [Idiomarina piscisalsi]|uniref:M61 family metallopeptidase n=1 Tax=Idiomarina piscisalsi TaxID=1096243 RepID=UPI001382CCC2|nr:PDZ domain-containing protein [Idiomarina piscisalsi]MTJ01260.1 M61 family metallopeptidase [Idiomarina piscisalsi]